MTYYRREIFINSLKSKVNQMDLDQILFCYKVFNLYEIQEKITNKYRKPSGFVSRLSFDDLENDLKTSLINKYIYEIIVDDFNDDEIEKVIRIFEILEDYEKKDLK